METVAELAASGPYAAFCGVAKKDIADIRGCYDGQGLNEHVCYEHFKMEWGSHDARLVTSSRLVHKDRHL